MVASRATTEQADERKYHELEQVTRQNQQSQSSHGYKDMTAGSLRRSFGQHAMPSSCLGAIAFNGQVRFVRTSLIQDCHFLGLDIVFVY